MNIYTKTLNLFGLIKYKKALEIEGDFEKDFDECYRKGTNVEVVSEQAGCYIGALENDLDFTNKLTKMGAMKILNQIFGDNYYFWGSDLTPFKGGSNFHRDSFTQLPTYKMGIYLENSYGVDQKFIFVPGSHKYNDNYSKQLSEGLNWPSGSGLISGIFSNTLVNDNFTGNFVPAHHEEIERGDIILFDNRLIHAVAAGSKLRRLIAISVIPNYELAKQLNPYFINFEIYRTYVLMLRISCQAVELKNSKTVRYGQKNLAIEKSEFGDKLLFRDYSDEDIELMSRLIFKEQDRPIDFINQV